MPRTPTTPQVGIGRLLRTASTAFNRVFRSQLAPLGITYGQFQYLQGLWDGDGLTQTELTHKVGVEMASSTAILDSLEEGRLIKRVRNQRDRRKLHVYLTADGKALKNELMACAVATNVMARRGISNGEVLALFDILGRLVDNMHVPADDGFEATRNKVSRRTTRAPSLGLKSAKPSVTPQF